MKPTLLYTIVLVALLSVFSNTTTASTYYWLGTINSNWNTSGNWILNGCSGTATSAIPGSSDSAVFSGSCNANCTINVSITVLSIRTDASYTGTITQGSGNTVTATYAKFGSGTFLGDNAAITFSSLIIESSATFTATSTTTTLKGNFTLNSGTFNNNNGRVVFYNSLTISGTSSPTFYDAEFQAVAGNTTITLSNNITVSDSLLLTGSNQLFINSSNSSIIYADGQIKIYNTSGTGGGSATIDVNGTSTQNIIGNATTEDVGKLPNLTINSTGTVYLIGYITMGGSTTITYTAGTINAGTSDVVFYYDNTITGSMTFNNVVFQGTGSTFVVPNTITVNGNIYTTSTGSLSINTGTINLYGNFNISNTSSNTGGSATVNFSGSVNDSIIASSITVGQGYVPKITINKTAGTLTFIGNISTYSNWTNNYSQANINPGASTLYINGYYGLTIGGTYPTPTWNVELYSYEGIITLSEDSALIVKNNLTLTGTYQTPTNGYTINIYGNIIINNTGTGDEGGSTVFSLLGSANDTIKASSGVALGEGYLPNIQISKTGGNLYLIGDISLSGNWTNNYSQNNINPGTSTLYINSYYGLTIGGTYPTPAWNVELYSYEDAITLSEDSALIVKNNLTLTGSYETPTYEHTINIYGNIIINNTGIGDEGSTVFNLVSSLNDTIKASSGVALGEGNLPNIQISKTGGNLYLIGNISVSGNWTNNFSQNNIFPGTSTLFFNAGGNITIGGTYNTPVWNASFYSSENDFTFNNDSALIVKNNLTITGSHYFYMYNHAIPIYGNIIANNTADGVHSSTTTFNIVGSNNDTINSPSGYTLGECYLPNIYINKTGGTLFLAGNITLGGSWSYNQGTVNAGTSTVGNYNGGTLSCVSGSNVMSFNNLTIGSNTTLAGAINMGSNLTINSSQTLHTSASNYPVNIGGNWINNGTYTGNNSTVTFGGSGGNYIEGSSNSTFYSLTINQSGNLALSDPTTVTNALTLTSGDILTTSTDLLTLNNGSSVSGGSDNSFVNGPIKKIGNSAFTFPTGANSSYHPIGITAPSSTSDAFEAQYAYSPPAGRTYTDDSLTYVSACDYWLLSHPAGSSSTTVSLFWGTGSCNIDRLSSLRVGYYNTTTHNWINLGQSATTGSTTLGSVTATTASSLSSIADTFAISKHSPTPTANAGSGVSICYGSSTTLIGSATGGFSPYTYSWSPSTGLSATTGSTVTASPTATTTYTVTVEDDDNAPTATATVVVTADPQITVNAGTANKFYICSNDTLGSSPTASGGTSPYIYSWSSTPTGFTSAIANPIVDPTTTTTYNLTVTDNVGCTASSSVVITVDTAIQLNVPDTTVQSYSLSSITDTATWFKFTSDTTDASFWISLLGSSHFSNLYLYSDSSCHFRLIGTESIDSAAIDSIRTPIGILFNINTLTVGQTYYVKLIQPYGNTSSGILYYDAPDATESYWCYDIVNCDIIPPTCQYICNPYMQAPPYSGDGFLPSTWGLAWGDGEGGDLGPYYGDFDTYSGYNSCPPVTPAGEITVTAEYTGDEKYGYYTDVDNSAFETEINLPNDPSNTKTYILSYWYNNNVSSYDYEADSVIAILTTYLCNTDNEDESQFPIDGSETNCVPPQSWRQTISWVKPSHINEWYHVVACFIPPHGPDDDLYEPLNYLIFYPAADPSYEGIQTSVEISNVELMEVPPAATQTVTIPCNASTTTLAPCSIDCTTFSWTGPDGFTSSDPSVTVSTTGTYTCTMNVNYNQYNDFADGFSSCLPITITYDVTKAPGPTLTASPNPVCSGSPCTLTVTDVNSAYDNAWYENSTGTWDDFEYNYDNSIVVNPTQTTTYAVINNSCESNWVTVTVNPGPTVTTSPSPAVICGTGSVTLTASGATFYTWSPAGDGGVSTGASITASPTATTTYTVTNTSTGCSTQVVVTVDPPLSCSTADAVTIGCGGSGELTATVSGGTAIYYTEEGIPTYSYSWSPSSSLSCPTCSNPTASPTANTTYTVTVTDADGCTCTSTVVVTVLSCCEASSGCEATITSTSGSTSTSSSLSSSNCSDFDNCLGCIIPTLNITDVANGDVVFNGIWEIDEKTNISNSTIIFGPDAQIIIDPGKELTIEDGSLLTDGCDHMWQGIYINGSTANLTVEGGSSIQEADTAIYSHDGGVYTITGNGDPSVPSGYTSLLLDYYGIICDAYPYPNNHAGVITGSIISGINILTSGGVRTLLDPPHSSQYSAVGMEINGVNNITIGNGTESSYANTFSYLSLGIDITNSSNVNIYNNNFDDIYTANNNFPHPKVCIIDNGVSKTSFSSNLNVGALTSGYYGNSFLSDIYGIETFNWTQPSILNNQFQFLLWDIYVFNSSGRSVTIDYNYDLGGFDRSSNSNPSYGIAVFGTNTSVIQINNNEFSGDNTPSSYGIYLAGDGVSAPNKNGTYYCEINNNTLEYFNDCIYLQSSPNVLVYNNTLELWGTGGGIINEAGIKDEFSPSCLFTKNHINGPSDGEIGTLGFQTTYGKNSIYSCNTIYEIDTDMQFNGVANNPVTVIGNTFDEFSNYGVVLNFGATIGEQQPTGVSEYNYWYGEDFVYDLYTTHTDAGAAGNTWYYGQIPTTGTSSVLDPHDAIPYAPATTEGTNPCSEGVPRSADETISAEYVPDNDSAAYHDTAYYDTVSYTAVYYDTVYNDTTSYEPVTLTFNNQLADSIVLDSMKYDVFCSSSIWIGKESLFAQMLLDTAWESDTLLTHFYDTVQTTNMGIIANLENYIATDTAFDSTGNYPNQPTEATLVASISPTNIIEQNYQTVYSIYVNYVLEDSTLDSAQLAGLLAVATQCPYEGGAIVYTARGILNETYTKTPDSLYSFYYNDDSLCTIYPLDVYKKKIIQSLSNNSVNTSFVTAYPNPAKNQITFSYQYGGTDNATLDIYDVLGTKVGEYVLPPNKGQYRLGLSDLSNGVYYYNLTTPCCEVGTGKFVVVK